MISLLLIVGGFIGGATPQPGYLNPKSVIALRDLRGDCVILTASNVTLYTPLTCKQVADLIAREGK